MFTLNTVPRIPPVPRKKHKVSRCKRSSEHGPEHGSGDDPSFSQLCMPPRVSSLANQERRLLRRPQAVEVHLGTALAPRILIGMILARLEAVAPLHLELGTRGPIEIEEIERRDCISPERPLSALGLPGLWGRWRHAAPLPKARSPRVAPPLAPRGWGRSTPPMPLAPLSLGPSLRLPLGERRPERLELRPQPPSSEHIRGRHAPDERCNQHALRDALRDAISLQAPSISEGDTHLPSRAIKFHQGLSMAIKGGPYLYALSYARSAAIR